ncbi:hypothetical protein [Paracoccus everestensis]|uniref:hypothetical protein n=1 Tax=Paracoccus everestensis TaxID=2903900 RepID=UPI001F1AACC9|nr:hypothetical protein [Paracoccus everestensis]
MGDFNMMDSKASRQPALDKFYTLEATARACVGTVWRECRFRGDDLFIEPAAGAGAFSRLLPPDRLIALDIAPDAPGIEEQDFLALAAPQHDGRIIVLGNPPFGRGGHLAKRFIQHAAAFADVIAFILPASFAKASMQRGIDPRFHLRCQVDLPNEPFHTAEGLHRVNCVFQIWERRPEARVITRTPDAHPDFEFVTDLAEADLVIRRVGSRAGVILSCPEAAVLAAEVTPKGYSASPNYFIRAKGCSAEELRERLDTLPLAAAAARAVQPSLARRELVTLYAAAERVRHQALTNEPTNWPEAPRLVAAEGTQAMRGITRTGQPSEVDEGAKTPFMAPVSTSVWTARQRNVDSLYPVVGRMPHSGELILEQVPDAARAREVRIDPLGKPPELQSSFWRDFPSPSLPTQSSGSAKTASKKTIVAVSTLKSLMSRSWTPMTPK